MHCTIVPECGAEGVPVKTVQGKMLFIHQAIKLTQPFRPNLRALKTHFPPSRLSKQKAAGTVSGG